MISKDLSPDYVYIIGGGRWSRVLAEVIFLLTQYSTKISIYSYHNFNFINNWIVNKKFDERISVFKSMPEFDKSKRSLLIVANSSRNHLKSVLLGLNNNVPVFVEKPMTPSYEESLFLKNLSDKKNTILVSSNIFLFANYFKEFLKRIPSPNSIKKINLFWKDSNQEYRYGEKKFFDSSIPLFKDVLHHILPVLNQILGKFPEKLENLEISRGGAKIILQFISKKIPCFVYLERNSNERKRLIEVHSDENKLTLNFSDNNPFILKDKIKIYTTKKIKTNNKPIATMFKSLFNLIYEKKKDSRLNLNLSLNSSKIIDQINIKYLNIQVSWASQILNNKKKNYLKEDLDYFMEEFFQSKKIDFESALIQLEAYKI